MNKKIITAIIALTVALPTTAHSALKSQSLNSQPTLAIMDTALDTSLPIFAGKIVQEVCILEWDTCPNGTSYMEGEGASVIASNMYSKSNFDHGTQMASAALISNPDMNIVFIRIAGQNINGDRQISGEKTVVDALTWVINNRSKYNIQAVSMSQGHHNLSLYNDYCPNQTNVKNAIQSLIDVDVPTFFAAGNNRDYERIDWPSCVENSISVGAASKFGIELYTNNDPKRLDFFTTGSMKVYTVGNVLKNAAGTSISTQVAAAGWINLKSSNSSLTYSQIYDSFLNTATPVKGRAGKGLFVDIKKALSYIPTPIISGPTPEEIAKQKATEERNKLEAEVNSAIAAAEALYQNELKAAQDKLAATKSTWLAKLNG